MHGEYEGAGMGEHRELVGLALDAHCRMRVTYSLRGHVSRTQLSDLTKAAGAMRRVHGLRLRSGSQRQRKLGCRKPSHPAS